MIKKISSLAEMDEFTAALARGLELRQEATILALHGNLGAGKTAFVKSLAKNLGAKRIVQSPTFVIIKKYSVKHPTFKFLIHIDAYRLESEKELEILGWDKLVKNPENLIAIEWPENVKKLIPSSAVKLDFEFVDDSTRIIRSVSM